MFLKWYQADLHVELAGLVQFTSLSNINPIFVASCAGVLISVPVLMRGIYYAFRGLVEMLQ